MGKLLSCPIQQVPIENFSFEVKFRSKPENSLQARIDASFIANSTNASYLPPDRSMQNKYMSSLN